MFVHNTDTIVPCYYVLCGCWGPQAVDCVIGGLRIETEHYRAVHENRESIYSLCFAPTLEDFVHTIVYFINVPSNVFIIC